MSTIPGAIHRLQIELKSGLPQGLVSSGFFANAYLLKFDEAVGLLIDNDDLENGVRIHDYCRYVDDLRLVVSVDNELDWDSRSSIKEKIENIVQRKLTRLGGRNLKINKEKSNITLLSDLDSQGSVAGKISLIQGELSGPADRDLLDSSLVALDAILNTTEEMPAIGNKNAEEFDLFEIIKFDHDVKASTLKRFAANRLGVVTQAKRRITYPGKDGDFPFEDLNNEYELLAKKLILVWMKDPSLASVLRKALEIYPSDDLLEAVLKAIYSKTIYKNPKNDAKVSACMDYILADIFRFCIDFHRFGSRHNYDETINPEAMLETAGRWAQKVSSGEMVPIFLVRQAQLLLALLGKYSTSEEDRQPELHKMLHKILSGEMLDNKDQGQGLGLFEIAAQITGNRKTIARQLVEHLSGNSVQRRSDDLRLFAMRGGEFWLAIWEQIKSDKDLAKMLRWAAPKTVIKPKPQKQFLATVVASDSNGFCHELGLLKLAIGLLQLAEKQESFSPLSPRSIKVSISKDTGVVVPWQDVWDPRVKGIECEAVVQTDNDPRFAVPKWIRQDLSCQKIYWLGTVLRASALGGMDFTGNRWKSGKLNSYKGMRTSWYKRRMGMMQSPDVLVGDYATISDWTAELIMKCLQWPGFEATKLQHKDIKRFADVNGLLDVLNKRKSYLEDLYCRSSNMPLIPTRVRRKSDRRDKFRLVSVQQLMPRTNEFNKADLGLDDPVTRAKNRDHLSKVCQLVTRTLDAQNGELSESKKSLSDLIVFPEVSVHVDDIDLLKRLADKTKSMIFAGLVFQNDAGRFVNRARWIIPDYRDTGRQWIIRDQGKAFMTKIEKSLGIVPERPCQHIIELFDEDDFCYRITGSICYDATDLKLAADLKEKTDLFVICAHNKDVTTFDAMASALHYHMYQHVVVVNKGEFGGSTIQAPYKEPYERLISHAHGVDQISINIADLDLKAFKAMPVVAKAVKHPPAGHSLS